MSQQFTAGQVFSSYSFIRSVFDTYLVFEEWNDKYNNPGSSGVLGYPLSDVRPTQDGNHKEQIFENLRCDNVI